MRKTGIRLVIGCVLVMLLFVVIRPFFWKDVADMNAEELIDALIDTRSRRDSYTTVAVALRKVGIDPVPAFVDRIMGATYESQLREAFENLGEDAVPSLAEMIRKGHGGRFMAVEALYCMGPQAREAVPTLLGAIGDEDEVFRYAVFLALGHMSPRAADALDAFLLGPSPLSGEVLRKLRRQAFHAQIGANILYASDDEEARQVDGYFERSVVGALPALIETLQDSDKVLRRAAATALGYLGPSAKNAAPALEVVALEDVEAEVREEASKALDAINDESP